MIEIECIQKMDQRSSVSDVHEIKIDMYICPRPSPYLRSSEPFNKQNLPAQRPELHRFRCTSFLNISLHVIIATYWKCRSISASSSVWMEVLSLSLYAPAQECRFVRAFGNASQIRSFVINKHRPHFNFSLLEYDSIPQRRPRLGRVVIYIYTSWVWFRAYPGCSTRDMVAKDHGTWLWGE